MTIGAAGVVYAIWHETMAATLLFCIMFGIAFAVTLFAVAVAVRVRPAGQTTY